VFENDGQDRTMTAKDVGELSTSEIIDIGIAFTFMDTEARVLLGFFNGSSRIDIDP
jgi:hypothetical protein